MNPILTITKWSETFENADTRKRQRLGFFHAPSGCDSAGYVELMTCHGSAGLLAFGIFQALCQHSATMPAKLRGKFVRTNGSAMTLRQIALLLRVEICHLEAAVELLTDEGVAWLSWETPVEQSAGAPAEICHQSSTQSADDLPPTAGFVQGKGKGKGKGKESTTTLEGRSCLPPAGVVDDWSDSMPTNSGQAMAELQAKINGLHPHWQKRPHYSAKELYALKDNAKAWLSVEPDDWDLLASYLLAIIPDDWRSNPRDFFQPDNRLALINMGPTSILGNADKWAKECTKRGLVPRVEKAMGA